MARLDDGTQVEIQTGGTEPEDEDRIMELLAYANRKTADKLCENCAGHEKCGTDPDDCCEYWRPKQ